MRMLLNNMKTWSFVRAHVLRLAIWLTATNFLCMAGKVYLLILQFMLDEIKFQTVYKADSPSSEIVKLFAIHQNLFKICIILPIPKHILNPTAYQSRDICWPLKGELDFKIQNKIQYIRHYLHNIYTQVLYIEQLSLNISKWCLIL